MTTSLIYNPVDVTRDQLVTQASKYLTMKYNRGVNHVVVNEDGTLSGTINCFGFILAVARDIGLLNPDFNINLDQSEFRMSKPNILIELLHNNYTEKDKADIRKGDLILLRYMDRNPSLKEPHHVALVYGDETSDDPYGSIIHALDRESGGLDKVFVQRISPIDYNRIYSAWQLNRIVD